MKIHLSQVGCELFYINLDVLDVRSYFLNLSFQIDFHLLNLIPENPSVSNKPARRQGCRVYELCEN